MPPSPDPSLPRTAVGTASRIGRLMTATDVGERLGTFAARQTRKRQCCCCCFFCLVFFYLYLCVLPKGRFIPLSSFQASCTSCRDCFSVAGSLARRLCLCVCVCVKGQPVGGNTFQKKCPMDALLKSQIRRFLGLRLREQHISTQSK